MGFIGVYRALYDYQPQAEGELTIGEGDLLYIIEKNEDDGWWKAKKKAGTDDEDEPTGLVPHNYVEIVWTCTEIPLRQAPKTNRMPIGPGTEPSTRDLRVYSTNGRRAVIPRRCCARCLRHIGPRLDSCWLRQ